MKNINKFGAQRRQMQYIGKLMREVDTAPILAKLDAWKGKSQQHIAYMHQLERWRDRLMENDNALTELLAAHPQADAQRLRTLIRNAQKEMEAGKPPKSYREIFQVLREIIPNRREVVRIDRRLAGPSRTRGLRPTASGPTSDTLLTKSAVCGRRCLAALPAPEGSAPPRQGRPPKCSREIFHV